MVEHMGKNADLLTEHFAGPLGLKPWHPILDEQGNPAKLGSRKPKTIVAPGIKEQFARDFVLNVADALCPDYFWVRPASKSGYHPNVSDGDGGLVRHTLYACWWGTAIARAEDVDSLGSTPADESTPNMDAILAALILHDMMKEGDPSKVNETERRGPGQYQFITGIHGIDMADAIYTRFLQRRLPSRWHASVLMAIAGHMGPWTIRPEWRPIPSNFVNRQTGEFDYDMWRIAAIVSRADYASSRLCDGVMATLKAGIIPSKMEVPDASKPPIEQTENSVTT
jgi:hypothetical protein